MTRVPKTQLLAWLPALAAFTVAGFIASRFHPYPHIILGLVELPFLYLRAVYAVFLTMAAAAITARFLAKFTRRRETPILQVAVRSAWFVPLAVFIYSDSIWAIGISLLAAVGIASVLRASSAPKKQSPLWSSGGKAFVCVIVGALIELGLTFTAIERTTQAVLALMVATFILAWYAIRPGLRQKSRTLLIVATSILMTAGALIRNVGVEGSGYLFGNPFDGALIAATRSFRQFFGGDPPITDPLQAGKRKLRGTASNAEVKIAGLSHQGILLWPEPKKDVTLVPPLPNKSWLAFGKDHRDPLEIPFFGVYWFFRPPLRRPPPDSITMEGTPAVHSFTNNDLWPLHQEAHQNLQRSFDVSCCGHIQVVLTNVDVQASLIAVELRIADSLRPGVVPVSLGMLTMKSRSDGENSVSETIDFKVPETKLSSFDELTVRFILSPPREHDSAKVSVEKFRLIPKGRL